MRGVDALRGLLLVAMVACGHEDAPPRPSPASEAVVAPAPVALTRAEAPARRAAWLRQVAGYVADPATIPRLSDPAGRVRFEQLITEPALLDFDATALDADGEQIMRVFAALKALATALTGVGANDESVALYLTMDQVNRVMIAAGTELIARLPATDPTRVHREAGIEKVRIGAVINVCAILISLPQVSAPYQRQALERFTDEATYTLHSTASLQLLLASLDGHLGGAVPVALRPQLAPMRAVVAKVHADRGGGPVPEVVYQGLTVWAGAEARRVASRTGGFEIAVGPGALFRRRTTPNGTAGAVTRDEAEWREGEVVFEVVCLAGVSEDGVVSSLRGVGAVERPGPAAGRWLTVATAGREGFARVLPVGPRVCVASVEGPTGQVDAARRDVYLGSLRVAH